MSIKLLAMDMDGTCLNSRSKISKENLKWLNIAAEKGMIIVPTTGRSLSCLPFQLKNSNLYRYVISSNGAMITDINEKKKISKALMPLDMALKIIKDCKMKGLGISAHIDDEYIIEGKLVYNLGHIKYGKDSKNAIEVKDIISYATYNNKDIEELQFFFFNKSSNERCKQVLANYDVACAYSSSYVEIYSKEATKGNGLKKIADYLNISKDEIACIGDGENDLTMFKEANVTFAMQNAVEELKNSAKYIVSSNDNDGVAKAIQILLQE